MARRAAILVTVPMALAMSLTPSAARAACDCDHVLELSTLSFDGDSEGVVAGQSICVRGGVREALQLSNVHGSDAAPVVIRNCEGVARIENDTRGYGITLDTSEYVHLTGTGDGEPYGFYVRASKDGPDYSAMGVAISGYNHHIEIDHLEVVDAGFAGFIVKTDPSCENRDLRDHVQVGIELHHNLVKTPGGEAFYLGNTGFPSRTIQCDGQDTEVFPHWHEGLRVHHNRIEDTGWDGLQVAVTRKDCFVYNNVLTNLGTKRAQYQDRGIQLGGGAACDVYGNVLIGGATIGIFAINSDDVNIYNNVVADFEDDGIYVNVQESDPGNRTINIVHNTVIRSGQDGIQVFGGGATLGVHNNLVLEAGEASVSYGGDVMATDTGNLSEGTVGAAGFVDADGNDYRLEENSTAVGMGVVLAATWFEFDADGVPRDGAPDVGAYEYTAAPRPDGGTGVSPPIPDKDSNSGCGCTTGGQTPSGSMMLLALTLMSLRRRRHAEPRQRSRR